MQLSNRSLIELTNAGLDQRRERADSPAAIAGSNSVDHPHHCNAGVTRQSQRCEPLTGARDACCGVGGSEQIRRELACRESGSDKARKGYLTIAAQRGSARMGSEGLETKGW